MGRSSRKSSLPAGMRIDCSQGRNPCARRRTRGIPPRYRCCWPREKSLRCAARSRECPALSCGSRADSRSGIAWTRKTSRRWGADPLEMMRTLHADLWRRRWILLRSRRWSCETIREWPGELSRFEEEREPTSTSISEFLLAGLLLCVFPNGMFLIRSNVFLIWESRCWPAPFY